MESFNCEKCNTRCMRESVDVGVGTIYGPWGCPKCGWSENPEYDISKGRKYTTNDYMLDQYGVAYPPSNKAYIPRDAKT